MLGSMFCNAQSTTFWVLEERVRMTHHPHGIHQWKQRLGKEKCGWRLMSPRQCLTLNVKLRTKIMQLNTTQLADAIIILAHRYSKVEQPKSFRTPQPF